MTPSGMPSWGPTGAGTILQPSKLGAPSTRWPTAGRRSARTTSGSTLEPGETRQIIFLLGYHENPDDQKFDPPGSQTINKQTVQPIIAKYLDAENVDAAFDSLRAYWDELLAAFQVRDAGRAHRPHGQHLERLPVHGHLQPVALGLLF